MVPKQRIDRFRTGTYQEWQGSSTSTPPLPEPRYASGSQTIILSDNHSPLRLGKNDDGGPFHVLKHDLVENNFGFNHNRTVVSGSDSNSFAYNYLGDYYAKFETVTDSSFPAVPVLGGPELAVYGTTAIARCAPTNPLVDLAVTLGELRREGLPLLPGISTMQDRVSRARKAGGEYLNAEFGWRPLVNDVLALSNIVQDSNEILEYYRKNQGKLVRRRYDFPTELSSNVTVDSSGTNARPVPAIKTGYWNTTGSLTTSSTTRRRIWFSGAFTYALPPVGSLARKEAELAKRYGTRLTPDLLWNLTPWTWAVDWFTNLGDVVRNVSLFHEDGLVMPWGYVMAEQTFTTRYSHTGARTKRYNKNVNVSQTLTTTRKQRVQATPYGFGLNPNTFSDRQWAILVALGLSRGHGQASYE